LQRGAAALRRRKEMAIPNLYDSLGRPVKLAAEIGRGGEGSIWKLADAPDKVAKLYHAPAAADRSAKLRTMIALQSESLLSISAWPIDTLHRSAAGDAVGFVMRRAPGYQIHLLYGPKSRIAKFPKAHWSFLVQAATNLARAFALVHQHDLVVGDVNHGNILVSDRATVTMIDCDSFQVVQAGRCFPCGVGVETHLPPELQGRDLRRATRSPNHDAFGLAVLLFQMLFMARHPFSGRFLGRGDMLIPQAIGEFRFAYGAGAAGRLMQPPPHTLALDAVSVPVADLFERAFSPRGVADNARPSPDEWVGALKSLGERLQSCSRNPSHQFFSDATTCPWCVIENATGALLFSVWVDVPAAASGEFQIAAIWARIVAVPPPDPAPALPSPDAVQVKRSQAAAGELWWRRALVLVSAVCGLAFLGLDLYSEHVNAGGLSLGISILCFAFIRTRRQVRDLALSELELAERRLAAQAQVWHREAGLLPFAAKREELERKRTAYVGLPALRQEKLDRLRHNLWRRQLEKHLDRHRIEHTKIRGIGASRRAALQSYGIETAADVAQAAVERIPGFGPALAQRLVTWRNSIERSFVFDPARGIDAADRRRLDHEMAAARSRLERDLLAGPTQLVNLRRRIEVHRQTLMPQIAASCRRVAQARIDSRWL
jgi:DNA-binding helix-hairpin-helix protein with protein kinase domain